MVCIPPNARLRPVRLVKAPARASTVLSAARLILPAPHLACDEPATVAELERAWVLTVVIGLISSLVIHGGYLAFAQKIH
jgi:hypothetical protein